MADRSVHPSIRTTFVDGGVIKQQSVEAARLELLKSQRAAEIGSATGLFRVPAVLDCDPERGSITFERLRGVRPFREALRDRRRQRPLLERAARALGAIHAGLELPDEATIELPPVCVELPGAAVYVHGDFSIENLLYQPERDEFAIVDWCAAAWLGGRGTHGPRYVDASTLILSMAYRRWLGPAAIPNVDELVRFFAERYLEATGEASSATDLDRYFQALLPVYAAFQRRRLGWRSLFYRPSLQRLDGALRELG